MKLTKKSFSALMLAFSSVLLTSPLDAVTQETREEKAERMAWWKEARFGMFIHWGLYSVTEGEWNGKKDYGEWIQLWANISKGEYEKLAQRFNPTEFDADAWVQVAKDAGMKYLVLTTKHHDGFVLFDSKLTEYDIMDATPFKRDIVKELADACREAGIVFCVYYSLPDWHHPEFPAELSQRGFHGDPNPDADISKYNEYMKGQIRELLTNYGDIGLVWFDAGGSLQVENRGELLNAPELVEMMRELQPQVILNDRIGYALDYVTPEQHIPARKPWNPFEVCMTINHKWGYNKHHEKWKPSEQLIQYLIDIASKGGNYLLNVAPKPNGVFPKQEVARLKDMGDWMDVNGEAIYGTEAGPFYHLPWGRATRKEHENGSTLYLHVFDWPEDGNLDVPGLRSRPVSATLLQNGSELAVQPLDGAVAGMMIRVPKTAPDSAASVLRLDFDEAPQVDFLMPKVSDSGEVTIPADYAYLINDVYGEQIQLFHDGDLSYVGNWVNARTHTEWIFQTNRPGMYRAQALIAAEHPTSLSLRMNNGEVSTLAVENTGGETSYRLVDLGTFEVDQNKIHTLKMRPIKEGWQPIRVQSVSLQLVSE